MVYADRNADCPPFTTGDGEELEFRTADSFDLKPPGKTANYWDKFAASLIAEKGKWVRESKPPSGMSTG